MDSIDCTFSRHETNCISSTDTNFLNLPSTIFFNTFIPYSISLMPLLLSQLSAYPFCLYSGIITLFFQSLGITFPLHILFSNTCNHSTPSSHNAFTISAPIPDGPVAFPHLVLFTALRTSPMEFHFLTLSSAVSPPWIPSHFQYSTIPQSMFSTSPWCLPL
jgi:hypothetical protein